MPSKQTEKNLAKSLARHSGNCRAVWPKALLNF